MDIVDDTLREWRTTKTEYGQSDCMLSIGRYLARTGHNDVTGQFIGKYDDEAGALAMIEAHGGIAGLMALAGAVEKDGDPARGDVLELVVPDDSGELRGIGGLCTGGAVAVRLERGVAEVALKFVTYRGVWKGKK